ncbi:MAG: glycosyltransferase family 4 protein [Desulfobacteraceae bacterium]|nr:MAG: glycosyltransferase family 4 protein [Desulfobacteraceae bacterium]
MISAGLFISSIVLGGLGAWFVACFGSKMGLVDHPNERSSHNEPTPRGGGVGIVAAFLLVSIVSGAPAGFWAPAMFLSIIGVLTDIFDLSPVLRLPFQIAAGGIFAAAAMTGDMPLINGAMPAVLIAPAAIYIVGTANFYNFMDGINGIAGITGILAFGLLGVYLHITGNPSFLKILAFSISLACVGFLPFNVPAARVFMGDVGSILLGFLFGGMVILLSKSLLDFLCLVSFLFPFYADELNTMAVRLKGGESLLRPHRKHIYQLLANEKGIAHWRISASYGFIQLLVGGSIICLRSHGIVPVFIILLVYLACFSFAGSLIRFSVHRQQEI